MMSDIEKCSTLLQQAEKRRNSLVAKSKQLSNEAKEAEDLVIETAQLKAVVISVANQTQLFVAERISSLVSMALRTVGFQYDFKVDFVQRRNNTEADLLFVKNNHEMYPLECSGGGAVDIASFALRLALWSMKKSSNVFILDEPFKHLSLDRQAQAGEMLHELANQFDLQIIMVSHNPEIVFGADNIITL